MGRVGGRSLRSIIGSLAAAVSTAGPASAAAPLAITFDHPAPGATVCGQVAVGETILGGTGPRSAALVIDGTAAGTFAAGSGPQRIQPSQAWDTRVHADGTHVLTVSVSDAGGITASATLTLQVVNHAVAAITSPADGARVRGAVAVTITGAACGLRDFTLAVDGAVVAALTATTSTSTTFTWDSTGTADGAHTLSATVTGRGIGGDMTATTSISVNVSNAGGGLR